MIRILFVDDEANILAGLKRTMRCMRNEWEMDFVEDPLAALQLFEQQPFDVVVSDMKMPQKDGADLLSDIKQLSPDTIRIILSGHADAALIMKSVGSAHQYLAKPCDPETLKSTIKRAHALKELVGSDSLRGIASGIDDLPTLPATYQEIVQCLQDPESSLVDVGPIVGKDIGMTAKILQLVNSSFFGVAAPVKSIEQSVTMLGIDTISALVLGHGMFSHFNDLGEFNIEALWNHSARCSALAKMIAEMEDMPAQAVDNAFLAGMLHDVGQLVLASEKPGEYAEVRARVEAGSESIDDVERELLHATHGEVGAYLLGLWGLPDTIVEAVAFHETPGRCHAMEFGLPGVVHAASRLAQGVDVSDPTAPALRVDIAHFEKFGVLERWPTWLEGSRAALDSKEGPE